MSIFEKASRFKLTFPSAQGDLTVDQLWDLPLESTKRVSLDGLAMDTQRELEAINLKSFIPKNQGRNPAVATLTLRLDILKHIITTLCSEKEDRKERAARTEERARLVSILASKQEQELHGLDSAELQKRIASLDETLS